MPKTKGIASPCLSPATYLSWTLRLWLGCILAALRPLPLLLGGTRDLVLIADESCSSVELMAARYCLLQKPKRNTTGQCVEAP
jgi:hypothetical protein